MTGTHMSDDGWVLLSDAVDHHLQPTNVVHHISGCNVNNGRNKLYEGTAEQVKGKRHCTNCEAKLARMSRTPAPNHR
jgi:hypothetical protein